MTAYTITKKFTSSAIRTPRVLEIAESFGLGLSDQEFTIFDGLELEVVPGDVVYINGTSGSGKSLLLKLLAEKMAAAGHDIADLNEVVLEDKPVIELVGETTLQATDLLSKAGISDAWIYIKTPAQLSDGQRYRLKLAKVLDTGADVWIADEFGAVLDRVTAKVVAFNLAKVARREGKILMVATTHTDLAEDLNPSLTVTKGYRERVSVERAAA